MTAKSEPTASELDNLRLRHSRNAQSLCRCESCLESGTIVALVDDYERLRAGIFEEVSDLEAEARAFQREA